MWGAGAQGNASPSTAAAGTQRPAASSPPPPAPAPGADTRGREIEVSLGGPQAPGKPEGGEAEVQKTGLILKVAGGGSLSAHGWS